MIIDIWILLGLLGGGLGFGILGGFFLRRGLGGAKVKEAEERARTLLAEAEQQAKAIKKEVELEAKDLQLKAREVFDREVHEKQREMGQLEKRLVTKEENLDKKVESLEKKEAEFRAEEQSLADRKKNAEGLERRYNELVGEARKTLEKIAGVSMDEAKRQLIESLTDDAKSEAARKVQEIEEQAKEEATKRAQRIISTAIERIASDYSVERTVTVVQLPSEDMKGRIIGREGRNIRALEAATGIDFVIDDTPEAVILTGFNPIRREIARITLENLIADGRIHPARIEEMVAKVTKEVEASMRETGEKVCLDLNITNMHPELMRLVGALKFRHSFAQNILQHSVEVAHLCGMMAAELGLDQKKAKRAALLHDIGKAVSHEVEGSHALIGMEFCKKYKEPLDICHAVGAHHEDIPQETPLDLIVDAADALSGARPGARREVLEAYVKRLEDLERISTSFRGVEKTYALQAGREIRVMVFNEQVNDAEAVVLSNEIAKKIEEEMTYPGQIKVTVIRESRASAYAK